MKGRMSRKGHKFKGKSMQHKCLTAAIAFRLIKPLQNEINVKVQIAVGEDGGRGGQTKRLGSRGPRNTNVAVETI